MSEATWPPEGRQKCLNCTNTFPIIRNPHQKIYCCVTCRNAHQARIRNNGIKYIKKHHPDIYERAFVCQAS